MQSKVNFHKRNHFTYILFLFVFFAQNTYAETLPSTKSITGKVITIENETATPLPFASVQLLLKNDSSFVKGTTTNEDGIFQLSFTKEGEYLILISSVGYLQTYEDVKVHAKKTNYDLGEIVLPENAIVLAEASVVAQRREMIVKEDTVEYDATAYRLRENAVVEDLLKRLPGITIDEDGRIFVNGKEVKKVMVDGQDFFRSNPNLSIKNIPAHIMDKLQVIEDKSELSKLTGIDDGEENIVINIGIQKDKKRGWLSSNNIGIGQELDGSEGDLMRYSVNSFAARLYDETQLGIVVNGNNINGMTIGGSGSTTGSGKPGLNSSFSTGINFSSGKEKKSPWIINGDLSYGQNESMVNRNSMRQYYLLDSTSYQADTATQISRTQEIRFSGKIENRSIEGWTFSFTPSASYNVTSRNNSGFSLLQAGNADRDSVNTNNYTYNSMTPGLNLRGVFTASHRFKKKGRRLSFSIDSRFGATEGAGETNARYYYYRRKNNPEVIRDQQWETNSTNFNNRLYFSYIEPIAEKHSLQFVYWVRADNRENIRNNYKPDPETGDYSILDIPYSKSIENLTVTQQLGVSYRGTLTKLSYVFGLDFNPSHIRSRSFIQSGSSLGADSTITYFPGLQTYNFAPVGYMIYNIGNGKNMRFDYRGRTTSPTVEQLDPSRDESRPTNIYIGNPDLLPKFSHWSRLRYNDNNRTNQQSIMANIEGNYILNDIINFTDYDGETGIKTTSPVNQSGSWNVNGMFMYNRPLSAYFQINNYTRSGIRNNIGFSSINSSTGSQKTIATTTTLNQDLGLTFKLNRLYMMGKVRYELSNTAYSNENMLDKRISSIGGFLSAQLNLPKSWAISSEMNYRSLTGFSTEYNQQELLWNAEISKNFLKNNAGTITLIFNDILQQQLSVTQFISSNYVEDRQFNTLKSFVMLAFSYKFNTMGK
ncbi:MAG: outer membrane beta-barrel protein [Paludibacter sp.]|nr:outer membrane beta-barrel protein [Paludibacter sp.]